MLCLYKYIPFHTTSPLNTIPVATYFYFIDLKFITLLFTTVVIARFPHFWSLHMRNIHVIMDFYNNFCTWTFCPNPPSLALLPLGSGGGHIFTGNVYRWLYINWNHLYKPCKSLVHFRMLDVASSGEWTHSVSRNDVDFTRLWGLKEMMHIKSFCKWLNTIQK